MYSKPNRWSRSPMARLTTSSPPPPGPTTISDGCSRRRSPAMAALLGPSCINMPMCGMMRSATTQNSATGTHILDTVASTTTQDSTGNHLSCSDVNYDGQGYLFGQSSALTGGLVTAKDSYTNCGTASNGFTPSGQMRTTMTYDAYGNQVTSSDPDTNSGISGHTGCTVGSTQYTNCSAYDSTFQVLPTSSSNALNQTSSIGYTSTALGGFGLWPVSTTDPNNQSTT